ncbi:PspC domain-containing protein [Nocardiopsis sp. NPDC058631]|uniref:PspC domain-containing protein n=1 Tax=Nocardiopsis sp. NPDC058631 TaxID=3346566 RepID=UPI00364DA356
MTMADDPTTEGSGGGAFAASGSPGAPGGGPATAGTRSEALGRELRKEDEDRVLGGVCAGLARYTQVDPVVWRTAFVLTAFASGTGLLLYIAAWMLMRGPEGGPATFEQMLNRSFPSRAVPKLLAVGLAVATAFSVVGGLGWSTLVLAIPLVLGLLTARNRGVDLRAAFAELRQDLRSKEPPPAAPVPGPTPTYYNPAQPWASAPQGPVDLAVVAERSAHADGADGVQEDDEPDDGADGWRGGGRDLGSDGTCRTGAPLASFALWTVVTAAVLVPVTVFGWSPSLWSAQSATLLFGPETGVFFLSGVLAVVGLYALVGTWAGDPRGLMSMGLVAALALALASVTDLTRVRVGGETWRPATVAEAESGDHRLTVGSGTLDLSGLGDLEPGETADVSVSMGAGHLEVVLPDDARVALTTDVGFGVVDLGGTEDGGELVGRSLVHEEVYEPAGDSGGGAGEASAEDGAADPPLINVRTDSLVGVVEVRHGEA